MSDLTESDVILLRNLEYDIRNASASTGASASPVETVKGKKSYDDDDDESTALLLAALVDVPTAFTSWDNKDISKSLNHYIIQPYLSWAITIVRKPADTVFLTHILIYTFTLLPSALYLYYNFTWVHGFLHWALQTYCAGPWTLLLHNHIHNHGILGKKYSIIDNAFPYILGPLMGHTWDSYYYHHVKHHHVENNGPDDLSTTIYFQRDSIVDFLKYEIRFLTLGWIELPMYFYRKNKLALAAKSLISECTSICLMFYFGYLNIRPSFFVLLWPLFQMRVGMMIGNWGQHCLVDELEPLSNFRSSITLIDVPSNRHCFNDGYHTSHHLNSTRHWKEHPSAFLKAKASYQKEGALTFQNIDYLMMTFKVLQKDYDHLAKCLIPMGDQINMTHQEKMDLLRSKTQKFSAADINEKFRKPSLKAKSAKE